MHDRTALSRAGNDQLRMLRTATSIQDIAQAFGPACTPCHLPDRVWRRTLLKALAPSNDYPSYQRVAKDMMPVNVDRSLPRPDDMSREPTLYRLVSEYPCLGFQSDRVALH